MLDMHNCLARAQTACLETFCANGTITAQGNNWHERAQRLTDVAQRRVSAILRDVAEVPTSDMTPDLVALDQYARTVSYCLLGAIDAFQSDMYGMAQPSLFLAEGEFLILLDHLRKVA